MVGDLPTASAMLNCTKFHAAKMRKPADRKSKIQSGAVNNSTVYIFCAVAGRFATSGYFRRGETIVTCTELVNMFLKKFGESNCPVAGLVTGVFSQQQIFHELKMLRRPRSGAVD